MSTSNEKAMRLALEALEDCRRDSRLKYEHKFHDKVIKALKAALAQSKGDVKQEQRSDNEHLGEPVAWIEHHKGGDNLNWEEVNHPYAKATPLYTTPQQRTWVGLTDDEIRDAIKQSEKVATGYAGWVGEQRLIWGRAIEAKLREKNSL
jgi:hypothetical protein